MGLKTQVGDDVLVKWRLHTTKLLHTEVLSVCLLVALHVQQRVAVVDDPGSVRAAGNVLTLAVPSDEETVGCRPRSWETRRTLWAI